MNITDIPIDPLVTIIAQLDSKSKSSIVLNRKLRKARLIEATQSVQKIRLAADSLLSAGVIASPHLLRLNNSFKMMRNAENLIEFRKWEYQAEETLILVIKDRSQDIQNLDELTKWVHVADLYRTVECESKYCRRIDGDITELVRLRRPEKIVELIRAARNPSYEEQLIRRLVSDMAEAGYCYRVLDLFQNATSEQLKSSMSWSVARAFASNGYLRQAEELAEFADSDDRNWIFDDISNAYLVDRDIRNALKHAQKTRFRRELIDDALTCSDCIAMMLTFMGCLPKALCIADEFSSQEGRDRARLNIVSVLIAMRGLEQALKVAEGIDNAAFRSWVHIVIAAEMVHMGKYEEALAVSHHDEVLLLIAMYYMSKERLAEAKQMVGRCDISESEKDGVCEIFTAILERRNGKMGDTELSDKIYDGLFKYRIIYVLLLEALKMDIIVGMADSNTAFCHLDVGIDFLFNCGQKECLMSKNLPSDDKWKLVRNLAFENNFEEALDVSKSISDRYIRLGSLKFLWMCLASQGKADLAKSWIHSFEDRWVVDPALADLAVAVAQTGAIKHARSIVEEILSEKFKRISLDNISRIELTRKSTN